MKPNVLVVDDDALQQEQLVLLLERDGYSVLRAANGRDALDLARRLAPEVVLLDKELPDIGGLQVLATLRQEAVDAAVILLTGFGDIPTAVEAMQLGAETFLTKPYDVKHLLLQVARAVEKIRLVRTERALRAMARPSDDADVRGQSPAMAELRRELALLAQSADATVLLLGESGSGKGFIARWLHRNGPRHEHAFVELNCASFTSNLLESELFGHEKGAFTDAKATKKGLLEVAAGGIVFLDEVGDLPPELQPKLLTFLESKRLRRVGGLYEIEVDVQIFAATNHDLKDRVEQGRFRKDLYYRLAVLPTRVPALRERPEDIVPLAHEFYDALCRKHGRAIEPIEPQVLELLAGYPWPGNVRELRNVLERAFILGGYRAIEAGHLPAEIRRPRLLEAPGEEPFRVETLAEVERRHILRVLRALDNNISATARALDIGRSTLFQKLKHYRLGEGAA
jgi:two-component system, NtrC family, response regulator AtoC